MLRAAAEPVFPVFTHTDIDIDIDMTTHDTLDNALLRRRVEERLTAADTAAFAREGAIVVRQLLNPRELSLLREGIEVNFAHPSPRAEIASWPDGPRRFFEDF